MQWVNPIVNRTQADVEYADAHRGNLTENIGARSHWTLQRIADNMRYVVEQFTMLGISTTPLVSKAEWLVTDIPTHSEIQKFKTDLDNLRAAGFIKPTTPVTPSLPWTHWQKLNDIEQMLLDMVAVVSGITAPIRYSGMFYSNQEGLR